MIVGSDALYGRLHAQAECRSAHRARRCRSEPYREIGGSPERRLSRRPPDRLPLRGCRGDNVRSRDARRANSRAGSAAGRGSAADGYEIRTGGWRLDLPAAVAKAAACSTVTTILLRGVGADSVPATVLSIVAPLLFELERIEVSAEDLIVHAYLTEAASNDVLHLAELYERLPVDVQSELSVREFAGAVERLRDARLLVVGTEGVKLQHPGAANGFKLYLR